PRPGRRTPRGWSARRSPARRAWARSPGRPARAGPTRSGAGRPRGRGTRGPARGSSAAPRSGPGPWGLLQGSAAGEPGGALLEERRGALGLVGGGVEDGLGQALHDLAGVPVGVVA